MKWTTPALTSILTEEIKAYKAAKGATRNTLLSDIKARLQDEAKATGVTLPRSLDKVRFMFCLQW
jgi:hypothetical protein